MECPFFIPGLDRRLYAVLFRPESPRASAGIVVCPPFADEALHAHRTLVEFCRLLAATGVPALYFDYLGTGDSEGAFEESSLATYLEDIGIATRFLRDRGEVHQCGLLGLRLGATLAIQAAGKEPALSPLILWAPLADPSAYFRTFLRRRLFTEMTTLGRAVTTLESLRRALDAGQSVDVQGYEISPAMARDFATLGGADGAAGAGRPALVAGIGVTGRDMASSLAEAGFAVTAFHVDTESFWELARVGRPEALYEKTLDWLTTLGGTRNALS